MEGAGVVVLVLRHLEVSWVGLGPVEPIIVVVVWVSAFLNLDKSRVDSLSVSHSEVTWVGLSPGETIIVVVGVTTLCEGARPGLLGVVNAVAIDDDVLTKVLLTVETVLVGW